LSAAPPSTVCLTSRSRLLQKASKNLPPKPHGIKGRISSIRLFLNLWVPKHLGAGQAWFPKTLLGREFGVIERSARVQWPLLRALSTFRFRGFATRSKFVLNRRSTSLLAVGKAIDSSRAYWTAPYSGKYAHEELGYHLSGISQAVALLLVSANPRSQSPG
jgi:hypothetical protein